MMGTKKCSQENAMFDFGMREKNFCSPPDVSNGLGGSCLGPKVSPELNGVIIRRFNRFLCYQASASGDFFVFKAFQSHFQWILEEKLSF